MDEKTNIFELHRELLRLTDIENIDAVYHEKVIFQFDRAFKKEKADCLLRGKAGLPKPMISILNKTSKSVFPVKKST